MDVGYGQHQLFNHPPSTTLHPSPRSRARRPCYTESPWDQWMRRERAERCGHSGRPEGVQGESCSYHGTKRMSQGRCTQVSGSAYKIIQHRAYHHGTMLISSSLAELGKLLKAGSVCPRIPILLSKLTRSASHRDQGNLLLSLTSDDPQYIPACIPPWRGDST